MSMTPELVAVLPAHKFDEARLLNIAHQYQQNTDWHLQRPEV